jgi:hypothetical protein
MNTSRNSGQDDGVDGLRWIGGLDRLKLQTQMTVESMTPCSRDRDGDKRKKGNTGSNQRKAMTAKGVSSV